MIKIARGFGGYGMPLADLVAEGNVGLMRALARFDPERGFRFATYAMWWIRAAIQKYVLHNRSLVTIGASPAKQEAVLQAAPAEERARRAGISRRTR